MHRSVLQDSVKHHGIKLLPNDPREEIEALAAAYIQSGVIPLKKAEDALHVAFATMHQMDILLSWNFRHLANVRRDLILQVSARAASNR